MNSENKVAPTQLYIKILDCDDPELQCMDALSQVVKHFLHAGNHTTIEEPFQLARVADWMQRKYGIPPESIR
jgi:hypothetical protein